MWFCLYKFINLIFNEVDEVCYFDVNGGMELYVFVNGCYIDDFEV